MRAKTGDVVLISGPFNANNGYEWDRDDPDCVAYYEGHIGIVVDASSVFHEIYIPVLDRTIHFADKELEVVRWVAE